MAGAGPPFDAAWYAATYPDVGQSGLDPRVHFLKYGRAMGRPGTAEGVWTSPGAGRADPAKVAEILRRARPRPGRPEIGAGIIVAAPAGWQPDPPAPLPARPELPGAVPIRSGETVVAVFETLRAFHDHAGPLAGLRLLLGGDVLALPETRGAPGCGRVDLLQDARMRDEGHLRLTLRGGAEAPVLRVFQADPAAPGKLRCLGGLVVPGAGPAFRDLPLCNPLMPILLEQSTEKGLTRGLELLPFPSLLDGGWHAAERAAWQLAPDAMAEARRLGAALLAECARPGPPSIGRVAVELAGANGTEPVLAPRFRDWMRAIFGLGVTPADAVPEALGWLFEAERAPLARPAGMTLTLPAEAVPSLAALTARRLSLPGGAKTGTGPFLVARAGTHAPLWSVALPATATGQGVPRLTGAGQGDAVAGWLAPLHLAVVFRGAEPVAEDLPVQAVPARAMPTDPEAGLALEVGDASLTRRFLVALATQPGVRVPAILLRLARPDLAGDAVQAARETFPDAAIATVPAGPAPDLDEVAEALPQSRILLAEDPVLPDDPRLLSELIAKLETVSDAASLACALWSPPELRPEGWVQRASAGLFPSQVSLATAPRLGVWAPDCLDALPRATFPVLANTFHLCLIRRAAIRDTAAARADIAGGAHADLKFGLDAAAAGWRSLSTTALRAGLAEPPRPRAETDPFGLACLLPSRWDEVVSDVTVLRQLGG